MTLIIVWAIAAIAVLAYALYRDSEIQYDADDLMALTVAMTFGPITWGLVAGIAAYKNISNYRRWRRERNG